MRGRGQRGVFAGQRRPQALALRPRALLLARPRALLLAGARRPRREQTLDDRFRCAPGGGDGVDRGQSGFFLPAVLLALAEPDWSLRGARAQDRNPFAVRLHDKDGGLFRHRGWRLLGIERRPLRRIFRHLFLERPCGQFHPQ
jgi:hypothetical protein